MRSTDVGHLRHGGAVRAALEHRWVIVDVLHADDELGGWLQGSAGLSVCCRGDKAVLVLLLAVEGLGDVDIPRPAVNDEH